MACRMSRERYGGLPSLTPQPALRPTSHARVSSVRAPLSRCDRLFPPQYTICEAGACCIPPPMLMVYHPPNPTSPNPPT